MVSKTEQEETERLSQTADGKVWLADNSRLAEEMYKRAASIDPRFAKPHLGLGLLYQEQHRSDAAIAAYRKYLELAPAGVDRERVGRRVTELTSKGTAR
jgi:Flp pilus assembly protein TadD